MDNTEIEKKIEGETVKNNSNSSTDIEFNDFNIICKKTEKLASAVYLITNLFSDSEPMKWTLRRKVSEILSFIITYKDIRQTEFPNFIHTTKTKVLEIVSLLEVCLLGGLISQMNFSILKQEFFNLLELLNNKNKSDFSNEVIPKMFFELGDNTSNFNKNLLNEYRQNIKDSTVIKDNSVFKSNNRQSIILGLLKKRQDLTIKDIAVIIKDVSEKTIQRELISLISAGVIAKTGERRWSRYSLNNSQ